MKSRLLQGARVIAGIVIAWSTCWNFWNLSWSLGGQTPRETGEMVTFERSFAPIRYALWMERYEGRILGYVSARSLIGQKTDGRDGPRWSALRYIAIPYIVVPDPQDAPYVVGDYMDGMPVPETLDGFIKLFDQGDGLVLYKKVGR